MLEKIKNLGGWTIGAIAAVLAGVIGFVVWCLTSKKK